MLELRWPPYAPFIPSSPLRPLCPRSLNICGTRVWKPWMEACRPMFLAERHAVWDSRRFVTRWIFLVPLSFVPRAFFSFLQRRETRIWGKRDFSKIFHCFSGRVLKKSCTRGKKKNFHFRMNRREWDSLIIPFGCRIFISYMIIRWRCNKERGQFILFEKNLSRYLCNYHGNLYFQYLN